MGSFNLLHCNSVENIDPGRNVFKAVGLKNKGVFLGLQEIFIIIISSFQND